MMQLSWYNMKKGILIEGSIIWQCLLPAVQMVSASWKRLCKEAATLEPSRRETTFCCLQATSCHAPQWIWKFQLPSLSVYSLFKAHSRWPLTTGHQIRMLFIRIVTLSYPLGGISIRSNSTLPPIIHIISTRSWGKCLWNHLINLFRNLLRQLVAEKCFGYQTLTICIAEKSDRWDCVRLQQPWNCL